MYLSAAGSGAETARCTCGASAPARRPRGQLRANRTGAIVEWDKMRTRPSRTDNVVKLEPYGRLTEPNRVSAVFVNDAADHSNPHLHQALDNVPPADVYRGPRLELLERRVQSKSGRVVNKNGLPKPLNCTEGVLAKRTDYSGLD